MQKGTVKFYNTQKKFGFIQPSDQGQDIFVHESGLVDEIRENDSVEFDVERTQKGLSAIEVKILN
ncbi:MAG: cold-shock protein [Flavobacteriales bacterium]|nr:cold-shock protein [Flavobacteriales bacterium]|tara:strand:- start:2489 stop:2683 length:195 start_codon:yes stop_codon:yes gene_type:complete